ncbi:MAG: hypothetical protein KKD65_07815 [Gammaproteobacteria bacterium]|nr:hypothetical protein [Gammaproteobacteria bacterium]
MKHEFHRPFVSVLMVVLLILVVLSPILYSLRLQEPRVFWDSAMGNLFATAVALIVGIPIALWLDRLATARERQRDCQSQRNREKELLGLLKDELEFNMKLVEARLENPDYLYPYPFKNDFWDAATASGDTKVLSSRKVLDTLAGGYYLVRHVRRIEEQAHRAARTATVSFGGGKTAVQLLVEDAARFFSPLQSALNEALTELGAHEKSLA